MKTEKEKREAKKGGEIYLERKKEGGKERKRKDIQRNNNSAADEMSN